MAKDDVQFLDYLDEARMTRIKPYKVVDSDKTIEAVFQQNNRSCFASYGPDFRLNESSSKILVDPAVRYEVLLDELGAIDGLKFMTNRDMMRGKIAPGDIWCHLRHDVDADMRGQLDQARMEAERGIKSTFFILHSAPYYGKFENDIFYRNKCLLKVYRNIQDMGHEIALHTDSLHLFQNLGINGAEAIVTEIKWLRDNGIEIVGSVSHNSPSAYGCNNYSIFQGKPVVGRDTSKARGVVFKGKWAPLQLLDERELGLEYEGNQLFWQTEVPVEYAVVRSQDVWRCVSRTTGSAADTVAKRSKPIDIWTDQDGFIEHIKGISLRGFYLVVSVHCLYYGLRHHGLSGPTRRLARSTSTINPTVGWTTCKSHEIEAAYCDDVGKQRFQSVNMTNEVGFIDRPLSWVPNREVDARIAFLGRDNLHGATIGLESHVHSRVQADGWRRLQKTFRCWNVSSPDMGLGRSVERLDWIARSIKPNVVVVGIGANEVEVSVPEYWRQLTGYHPDHPPGQYFSVNDRAVEIRQASALHEIYRSMPGTRGLALLVVQSAGLTPPNFNKALDTLRRIAAEVVARIKNMGATPVFLIEDCGESAGFWKSGSDSAARAKGHAVFKSYLRRWIPAGVTVIDPYERFLKLPPDQPSHWDDGKYWNHRGHRITADLFLAHAAGGLATSGGNVD